MTQNNELVTVLSFLITRKGILGSTNIDFERLMYFTTLIQSGYRGISYHNKTHAADLCQTFNYFCKAGLEEKAALDHNELTALFVAACCHDYEHPGVNSVFLINIKDHMAIRHNDISVLESHHIAASFAVMNSSEKSNWMHKYTNEEFKCIRKLMIDAVFATDVTKHFSEVGQFKSLIA